MTTYPPLTVAQIEALNKLAGKYGRQWKAPLREAWMTGIYDGIEMDTELQQLRNTHGPQWLVRFRLEKGNRQFSGSFGIYYKNLLDQWVLHSTANVRQSAERTAAIVAKTHALNGQITIQRIA